MSGAPDTFGLHAAWAAGRVAFQGCRDCGAVQHPPGHVCGTCRSTRLAVRDVSGAARVVSWSRVHRAPGPEFDTEVPYVLVLVALAEGGLVQARWTADACRTGDRARLEPGTVAGRPVPVARPE